MPCSTENQIYLFCYAVYPSIQSSSECVKEAKAFKKIKNIQAAATWYVS